MQLQVRFTNGFCEGSVMAHKTGQGSTNNGRDSISKRRGVKKFGGEKVIAGNIIIRQCGTRAGNQAKASA